MSNAVTSLTAAIVQSDLKQKSPANSPAPNKLSLILTTSSLSSSSSNSEVNSAEEQLNLSMTSTNTNSNSKSADGQNTTSSSPTSSVTTPNNKPNHNKTNYYHPNHQQQHPHYINPHAIPMNLNFQTPTMNGNGLQYIQLNSNPNSINNGSPISSSPSTGNAPIQYIAHQQPHLSKHHHPNSYPSHHGGPPFQPQHQQQQFQQLQQFHSQFQSNYKDTRWLTLEVCREFQRNKCNRNETECKFAHPPPHVEIINGKVIACYDSLKGKCTRKEPACKYLHPPQHLKDQLLQNGKNNLVLRQVALAMMQQQQPNVQTNPETTAAILAAATRSTPLSQYATFTATSPTNTNSSNSSSGNPQFMPSLANGGLAYQQVQLASNGQPHLLQMLPPPNGYSHPNQHQLAHNLHMQQQSNLYANDPNSNLLQVTQNSTISPPSSVNNANSILPPQQRTDRLQQQFGDLNEANGAVYTLENGQYQLPQYQVYAPMFQRPVNNQTSEDASSQIDSANANNSSATSATANNVVENNGPSKKRQHDTIEQDFNPMNGNIYSVKRAALADVKTGMPVFQPLGQNSLHQLSGPQTGVGIHQLYPAQSQQAQQIALSQQIAALNYPSAYNISQMQYAPYPATFSLPYNGQPTSMPRL